MSVLQNMDLLPALTLQNHLANHESHRHQEQLLRPKSSIARLVQIAKSPVENIGGVVESWYDGSTKEARIRRQILEDQKRLLYLKLREATKYSDWQSSATALDELEGCNEWKAVFDSPDYNAALVEARLKQLDEARISCDVGRMLFLIRTSLTRDLGDMGNIKLYRHAHIGTKNLIERYIASALDTLNALLDVSAQCKCDAPETKYILDQVILTRQAFGRSALLLSGGATFGMNHIGVLKALWEARLLPRIISGASAGSIVCAVLCTRTDEDIPELLETFANGDLAVFEEERTENGLLGKITRFLKFGAMFDISHLTRVMKDLLGDMTFQEGYNRTLKILNICVSSASLYELPRLLNYVTAPNVLIWSAVAASCSVPFVFSAATILAKDPKTGMAVPWNPSPQRWIDGSVDNDLPMTRLAELFNVNHFIVSQVNPHVVPFLLKEEDSIFQDAQQYTSTVSPSPTWLNSMACLAKDEALHRMHTLTEIGILPNILTKAISVLSQKYSGDITIFPEIAYTDFPRMLSNPTPEFVEHAILRGERATWPELSRIKNHCAIELALDDAVQRLKARVAFSPSQVDLRIGFHSRSISDLKRDGNGKWKRRQRPLSQNSAPDTSLLEHTDRRKIIKPHAHHKSRSVNTLVGQPGQLLAAVQQQRNSIEGLLISPETSKALNELTSSGAETSILTSSANSSSSSLSTISPLESPSLPGSAPAATTRWWPRFFSTSQPSTPSQNYFWEPRPNRKANPSKSPASKSPTISSNSLSMTAKTTFSSSTDLKYRRSLHPQSLVGSHKDHSASNTDIDNAANHNPPLRTRRNWGLDIDMSGAKSILSRKRKGKRPVV